MSRMKYLLLNGIVVLVFCLLIYRLYIVSTANYIDGIDLSAFEQSIKTKNDVLYSERGCILDANGNVLAESVSTYKIVAYVNPKRSEGTLKQEHVSDVSQTANVIADRLGIEQHLIEQPLNEAIAAGRYQTYLGNATANISIIQKKEIEEYNLPGIEFEEQKSRSYPYGDFASYQVGYAKLHDNSTNPALENESILVGELGVEQSFNDQLAGQDGLHTYISDANGRKIPNTEETIIEPVNGNDIYLTIDKDIQLILESAVKDINEEYNPEVVMVVATEAKTGKILGVSATPSFNPNERNIVSYTNPLHQQSIEPGSTMKTFTYASAIEDGVYDPNRLYNSGSYQIYDRTIRDFNKTGWGQISLETGYMKSSNTGSSVLGYEILKPDRLHYYLDELGFGKQTGFDLPREVIGDISLDTPVDEVAATFGQGIAITPIQMVQALTVFGTGGSTMQPYIVDHVKDENGEIISMTEPQVSNANVYSKETVDYMMNMMQLYVDGPEALSLNYSYPQYGLVGKTGTAEIASTSGEYLTGDNNYTFSFSGLMPKEDPEIIVYMMIKKPNQGGSSSLVKLVGEVVPEIGELYNFSDASNSQVVSSTSNMLDYINQSTEDAVTLKNNNIQNNHIIIGSGGTVIDQYPKQGVAIQSYTNIYLKTDGEQVVPNLVGLSYRDAAAICDLLGLKLSYNGVGVVTAQSIAVGTSINEIDEILVELQ